MNLSGIMFQMKVKSGVYPTSDGISYLEAKHLLLLSYCQSLVYYLLRNDILLFTVF
ncbi:hypothetical protein Hanom_Chr07g00645521 [Helianthus anomalus]